MARSNSELHFFWKSWINDIWYNSLDECSARRKASTYTGQHSTETQRQTSDASSGIETHDPSNQAAKTP
jgi:hypothetical protein